MNDELHISCELQEEWVPQNLNEEMESASNTEDESDDDEGDRADQKHESMDAVMERNSESDDNNGDDD